MCLSPSKKSIKLITNVLYIMPKTRVFRHRKTTRRQISAVWAVRIAFLLNLFIMSVWNKCFYKTFFVSTAEWRKLKGRGLSRSAIHQEKDYDADDTQLSPNAETERDKSSPYG